MSITVVITNWKRPENLDRILAALYFQDGGCELAVWDNSKQGGLAGYRGVGYVGRSGQNEGCAARWRIARYATTPYVLVMDDDLLPKDPRVLIDTIAALRQYNRPVGYTGVLLDPTATYHRSQHVGGSHALEGDTEVDILKGRYVAMPTELLRTLPEIHHEGDDIQVSGCLGGGVVLASLQGRFEELPTGEESMHRRPSHKKLREKARRKWCSR